MDFVLFCFFLLLLSVLLPPTFFSLFLIICFLRCFIVQHPDVAALLAFLKQHEDDGALGAIAMEQLNGLVPPALAAWPGLQQVLDTQADGSKVFFWTATAGFAAPLEREQVFALSQLLMLQVGNFKMRE